MEPIPEEVKRFVEANLDSVDQMEILRVLGEDTRKEWRAADLAGEVQAQAIEAQLTLLQARGLVVVERRGAELFCHYGASTPELEERMQRLLQVYRERPVTMIKLLYAQARDPLRIFADAFRLKREG